MNYFQVNSKEIQVFVADFSPEVPLSEDKLVVSLQREHDKPQVLSLQMFRMRRAPS